MSAIKAGLPNIYGYFSLPNNVTVAVIDNVLFRRGGQAGGRAAWDRNDSSYIYFDASKANSIYGNADTVQAPAFNFIAQVKF